MPHPPELYQWNARIAIHFPGLGKPVVMGLALWSLGMIVVGACSLSAVTDWWSCRLGQPHHTVRERLRDIYREKEAKGPGSAAANSMWSFAGHLGWAGCWKAGPEPNWRLLWMRRAWGNSSWC